jgi:hypothetical protein
MGGQGTASRWRLPCPTSRPTWPGERRSLTRILAAYDVDGRAVEVCDTVMAADAYQLSYELPAH